MDGFLEDPETGLWLPPGYVDPACELEGEACASCGCTDDAPCAGGCAWVAPRLCSACADSQDVYELLEEGL